MRLRLGRCFALVLAFSWSARALVHIADRLDEDSGAQFGSIDVRVPNDLKKFRAQFERLVRDDQLPDQTFPRSSRRGRAKVALGVFSTLHPQEPAIRQILRDTWMRHPDVCALPNATDNCTIVVMFVIGNESQVPAESIYEYQGMRFLRSERDALLLDIKENMNSGKTFAWFDKASRNFDWADYIAKADEDVFLHATNVIDALPVDSPCQAFLGKPWTCTRGFCPHRSCGPPVGHNFSDFAVNTSEGLTAPKKCWAYMQGGFYATSRRVALHVTRRGGYLYKHRVGYEDAQTGAAVADYVRQTGDCVHIWNSSDVASDRMFFHMRCRNEHPAKVSAAWDNYYARPHLA